MTDERQPDFAFNSEDHLRLLQLMTRRAMSERRSRESEQDQSADHSDSAEGESRARRDYRSGWRLIPEDIALYEWQKECLPRWLKDGRGTVKVATGGGKTLFALAAAEKLQNENEPDLRLAIVVPTIPLMFQWYDEVRRGNVPSYAIGLMGGGQDLLPLDDLRILICVLNSARKRLTALARKAKWPKRMLLVVDECHRASATQARRIFESKPRYTLGLSATPEQDAAVEGIPGDEAYEQGPVGQALGPIIYDFTIKQSLEAGLLTPFEVWHVGIPLEPEEANEHSRLSREITDLRKDLQIRYRKSRSKQGFIAWCQTQASRGTSAASDAERFISLANRRKRLLYQAQARVELTLAILAETGADPEGRAIVFHESIDEIEALYIKAIGRDMPVVLEHSRLPDGLRAENIEAFRRGVAKAIISAKSLVEGFNVPSADLGIIAASTSSVRQRIQSLGRMLRRKKGGRGARIIVLYVRSTEDEAIYEKADWESIVGAERNRYFHWNSSSSDQPWDAGLEETDDPPRNFKPPSWEIDVSDLNSGDPYPGQSTGLDLRVDQSGNLRTEDGVMVPASPEYVEAIVNLNAYRRARRTPAGHLISRTGEGRGPAADWRYLGKVDLPEEPEEDKVIRLRVRSSSGKRVLALEDENKRNVIKFALGPNASRTPAGGEARDRLLKWIKDVEAELGSVKDLFWNGATQYWVEVGGERLRYPGEVAALEFRE